MNVEEIILEQGENWLFAGRDDVINSYFCHKFDCGKMVPPFRC